MSLFTLRGRARRASGSVRRRTARFAPSMIESLEGRRLLAAGNLGVDVSITPFASFVNLLQTPSWYDISGQTNPIVLNASGDPESDASTYFDLRVNQNWNVDPNAVSPDISGTYNLSFNGEASVVSGFSVQNQAYNAATNTTTAQIVVPPDATPFLYLNFYNTQATASSPIGTGISNAKLIRPGYAADSTQLYTNEFLAALKPYNTLRYVDADAANDQPFYDGNTLVTVGAAQVDQTGTPWEYQVALANATNTDMWINVPQGATDAYVAALAGIIKGGGTVGGVAYPGLNPDLKVYVEYSNEVWGGIAFNEYYQIAAVQDTADNHPLSTFSGNLHVYDNADGTTTTDAYTALGRRYLEETADIGRIFQGVLGPDPTHQRIRPVLGWQENYAIFFPSNLAWYEHFFGPAAAAFYGMGDANYLPEPATTSEPDLIAGLRAAIATYATPDTTDFTAVATYYGLANVSYEGGPSFGANGTVTDQEALAAARDPAMERLIYDQYEAFYAAGGALALYDYGPFGILTGQEPAAVSELSQYEDPSASPKFRGLADLAAAAPVAVTAGVAVPATGATSFAATTDALGENFGQPYSGQQGYWLLNVASAGSYDLKLTTAVSSGSAPGQVEVFVDDRQVGGVVTLPSNSVVDLGALALPAGLDTISLYVVHGASDPNGVDSHFNPATFTLLTPGTVLVGDSGFESIPVGSGNVQYAPTGSLWNFSGSVGNGSGVAGNNSALTSGNPPAPQGSQVAFLEGVSVMSQSVGDWPAGTYSISLNAAQRGNLGGAQNFEVLVDTNVVGTFQVSSTSYQTFTTGSFTVAAGTHEIELIGLDTAGGDNTALLDNITIGPGTGSGSGSGSGTGALPTVGDYSFEAVSVAAAGFAYHPSGSPWTFTGGAGLTTGNAGFAAGNGPSPQGSQVAFIQQVGSLTQVVAGWGGGTYTISFYAAQRGVQPSSAQDVEILVDGLVIGKFKPTGATYQAFTTPGFAVSAGAHVVEFLGLDSVGGDNTILLDDVTVASTGSGTGSSGTPTAGDSSFEAVSVGAGGFAYDPAGSAWAFAGGAGIAGVNSGFTAGNGPAPQGGQVAFLQQHGSFSQSVAGWAAGSYTISFYAAQRGNEPTSAEDFEVLVDGAVVGTFRPSGASYQAFTTAGFTVSAGSHTVEFLGLDGAGGDNTAVLDAVSIAVAGSAPAVGDSGFEAVSVGAGGFAYDPAGSAWAFAGSAGVSGANSGFTAGNGPAPQGGQVAFLQQHGSFSQSVAGWAAGSYTISFYAAQRGNEPTSAEDFEVLVDGAVVGTFRPSGASYQAFTTAGFTVSAGSHTVEFLGLDGAGGDNTAVLDAVTVAVGSGSGSPAAPTAGDSSFEAVSMGAGGYAYDPAGSAWAFAGSAGVSGYNSGFTSGNGPAPQGSQVAFLQQHGSFSQSVAGWAAGSYAISFDAAQRGNQAGSAEDFEVLVDGVVVGKFRPSGAPYQAYTTSTFMVSAGSHTIEFLGLNSAGGDNTAVIDAVTIH